jgi:hypothetical protein
MDARLPAHLEAAGILRLAESLGGFATVIGRGERDGGTILVAIMCRGGPAQLYERMPAMDGTRHFVPTKLQGAENASEFNDYLDRRQRQDPDIWIIEVDIDDPERFAAKLPQ